MDKAIIQSYEDEEYKNLSEKLREVTINQLETLIDDHILREKSSREPTVILKAIFKGCSVEKNHLSSHALAVFSHCLKLITSSDIERSMGTNILGLLLSEVDQLSTGGLVDTAKMIIEMIKSGNTGHGRSIEVLPKVLSCLEQKREVHLGQGQGSMPGYEYKKHLINTLCSGKWSGKSIIHLANVFKDVPMSSDEMGFFLRKMLRQLERLDSQEIPPLIHQMLPLAGKTHHETLLRGIFTTFIKLNRKSQEADNKASEVGAEWDKMFEVEEAPNNEQQDNSSKSLKMAEGTVLLHLTDMARWDQSLGKAFIKMLKLTKDAVSEGSISTLSLAFALCLSQTKTFKEQVLEQLRTIIFRCLSHEHRERHSNWFKQRCLAVPDVKKTIDDVVDCSKHGWDEVITGIVYLGFSLMDTYGPKGGAFGRPLDGDPAREDTPQQGCCDLGSTLLANVLKSHPDSRTEIIEQILNRVIKTSAPISHYIKVLMGISKRYPSTLLECKHKLREFFDDIILLSPQNADYVLRAILPLIRINSHLKDSLILVLRKVLFSCQVNGRVIACKGFLLLLQNFKVNGFVSLSQGSSQSSQSILNVSQIHVDVHSTSTSSSQAANHEPLCLEVLSILRRCLTQQATVRATLYQGLWDVIANNPHLTGPIMEKLVQHFRRYYEEHDGVLPPMKTDICVGIQNGQPALIEPLPTLLSSIFLCLKKGLDSQNSSVMEDDDIVDPSLSSSIHGMFESMTLRMIKSEMEDFEVDKSSDFSSTTSVGRKNSTLANMVIGCYQSLIEYNFTQEDMSEETANNILRLHSRIKKIKDAMSGGKKDSGKSSLSQFNHSPVFVKSVIKSLFCDESPDREVGLNVLRENDDFMKYALDITQIAVNYARDHGIMKGIGGADKTLIRETCMTSGMACLTKFMQVKNDPTTCPITHSCLEVFYASLQYIITRKRKRLEEFLTQAASNFENLTATKGNVIDRHVKSFQRIIISYLGEDVTLSSSHKKIIPLLVSIMDSLSSTSFLNEDEKPKHTSTPYVAGIAQTNEWLGKFCTQQIIDDTAITKSVLSVHLRLSTMCGPWTGTDRAAQGSEGAVRDMAKDIHQVAGDVEPGEEEESRMDDERKRGSHYQIIDECNVITLVPLIVSHIDSAIEETDWILQRIKGQVSVILADDKFKESQEDNDIENENEFHEKRRKTESAMCTRLGNLLIAYRELIQSALPIGPPTETLFKGMAKLFNLLTNITKYYTWLVVQGITKSPSPRFEKLIKLTGTEVTRFVYPFINYIESKQSTRNAQTTKKRKRKDEKESGPTDMEKKKVLRETKSIPPLIYAIENMERFLIVLGKKCKIDLLSGHKLPTSRDFRIKSNVVREALARREESQDDEGDDGEESSGDEEDPNSSKRPRPDN